MYTLSRLDPSYIPKVHRSLMRLRTMLGEQRRSTYIYCPCIDYKNIVVFDDTEQNIFYLVCRGFMKDYLIWTKHGEGTFAPYITGNPENIDADGLVLSQMQKCPMCGMCILMSFNTLVFKSFSFEII